MSHTLEEIIKTPEILKRLDEKNIILNKNKKYLFVGCGSSYNLGLISKVMLNENGYNAEVKTGGNVLLFDLKEKYDEAILFTRTGTSTETVKAAKKLKKQGIKTLGITVYDETPIVKECDESIVIDFAQEESVVMTGSFVFMIAMILRAIKKEDYYEESIKLIKKSKEIITKDFVKNIDHFVFLGFNENFGVSKEGALKLQEMAIQRVEYHEPLEYRHGPKSTVGPKSLVVLNSKNTDFEEKLMEEMKELGAKTLIIGENGDIDITDMEGFEAPLRMIPLQYLGYIKAKEQGLNPDKPQNLSKSVIL